MSYDMSIGNESFNYTYNVSKMWYAAMPDKGIRSHYGMTGAEAITPLLYIYTYMVQNRKDLLQYEPSNGWGSYEGALTFIHDLIKVSLRNPDELWEGD